MSGSLRLALTGDGILQRPLHSRTDEVVRPLFDLIRGADVAFTNLQVLPTDYRGDPALESGGSHFGAPASVLDDLVEAGFGLFAAATNHSLDYSISGLLHAMEAMDARRLAPAGVGRNLEDARRPVYHARPHRPRTSGEKRDVCFAMAPPFQELKPPTNPGRFTEPRGRSRAGCGFLRSTVDWDTPQADGIRCYPRFSTNDPVHAPRWPRPSRAGPFVTDGAAAAARPPRAKARGA